MMLLCLRGIPLGKDTLRIDVITEKGVVESIVAKPTADGFALFETDATEKLMEIHRGGSATSFVVSDDNRKIDLAQIFPSVDFKDFPTVSEAELQTAEGGEFKVTRSGDTFYVTGPSGVTLSIHK